MLAFIAASAIDFMNFTYKSHPCSDNVPTPVAISNGSASVVDPKDPSSGFDFRVDQVVEGSLAPGTRQVVVVMECDFPMGGVAAGYLYSITGQSVTLIQQVGVAEWGGDWGVDPSTIHIRFAGNFLYIDRCKVSTYCADHNYVVTTYAVRDGKVVKVYEMTHKRNSP